MDRLGPIEYRRLRAPREDAEVLIEPEASQVGQLVSQNRDASRANASATGNARTVSFIADAARSSCLQLAFDYTRQYRDVARPDHDSPLLLTGHQPQLFHPGVWFKHFAVDAFARQVGGIACNLIVDTDDATNLSITIPTGSIEKPRIAQLPLDAPLPSRPYE